MYSSTKSLLSVFGRLIEFGAGSGNEKAQTRAARANARQVRIARLVGFNASA